MLSRQFTGSRTQAAIEEQLPSLILFQLLAPVRKLRHSTGQKVGLLGTLLLNVSSTFASFRKWFKWINKKKLFKKLSCTSIQPARQLLFKKTSIEYFVPSETDRIRNSICFPQLVDTAKGKKFLTALYSCSILSVLHRDCQNKNSESHRTSTIGFTFYWKRKATLVFGFSSPWTDLFVSLL